MVIVGMAGAFFLDKPPGTWAKIGIANTWACAWLVLLFNRQQHSTYLHTLPEERR